MFKKIFAAFLILHFLLPISYAMSMEHRGSGTSWLPASTPMQGLHTMYDDWRVMLHGDVTWIYDKQGAKRGDSKGFTQSMLMLMAERSVSKGTLGLHAMLSLEPIMGKSGYPLLLQTGETANGVSPLIDRQHPHNFFMEMAGIYTLPITARSHAFLYLGYPGEPALGPPNFMHRFSGMELPEAPITHHWLDSTHITFGVATLGYAWDKVQIEGSLFNGREPEQYRWRISPLQLDSHALRLSFNPNDNWSMQISYGSLHSPEQLEPDVDQKRTTASVIYDHPFADNHWQTTLAWGRDNNQPGHRLNAYLIESSLNLHHIHTWMGRLENAAKDELFLPDSPMADKIFHVTKLSVGYVYDFPRYKQIQWGIGGLISVYGLPSTLQESYGKPMSGMLFTRLKIV